MRVQGYTVNDGNNGHNYSVNLVNDATGLITKLSLTITAVSNTKIYDGTTKAAAKPTVSGLIGNDSVTSLTETYGDANAGTTKTLSVATFAVNDGSNGNNYTVTKVANTTGVITTRALTVTAVPWTKKVDGTTSATGAKPAITSGQLAIGDTANFIETYADPNPNTGITLTPSGTVQDGNNGLNYAVTFVPANTGTILPPAASITTKAGNTTVTEPALGDTTTYTFTISLDAIPTQPVTILYSTQDGTAKSGTNYVGVTNGQVIFAVSRSRGHPDHAAVSGHHDHHQRRGAGGGPSHGVFFRPPDLRQQWRGQFRSRHRRRDHRANPVARHSDPTADGPRIFHHRQFVRQLFRPAR